MVFEYNEGDDILGFKAPRSNRFYFVHDPNGGKVQQLEDYHSQLHQMKDEDKPYRHLIGGFQLLQKLTPAEADDRLSKMI